MFSMEELEVLLLGAEHGAKRNEDVMRVASIIEVPELTTGLSDIRHAIKQQYKAERSYLIGIIWALRNS